MRIRLDDLTKHFDRVAAVDHVSVETEEGELFFLLGPSGCGKTTCLRLVAGFYEPDSGHVYFDDRQMDPVPPHARNTGMVFQNYALWPHMNVYKNVEYGLEVRNIDRTDRRKLVQEALEVVRMAEYADRYPNQLSGGQQQRIALARALVIKPDVLLLDEPLSNLDAKLRLEMRDEIRRIHRETRITTIYVTHDQKEALCMADRIAVMNEGRVEQVGTPREIYKRPINTFVASFIGETNFFDGTVSEADVSEGYLTIETACGTVTSSAADAGSSEPQLGTGSRVCCSIRPEALKIATDAEHMSPAGERANRFNATIETIVYLGEIEQHQLVVGDSVRMKMVVSNPGERARRPGEQIEITFDPGDVTVFPE